ncbi:Fumarate hydratase class II [compost metagenome]
MLIYNVLQSIRVLADGARVFALRLVQGLAVNPERLASNLDNPLLAVTALNPVLGYDRAAQITRLAQAQGISPREAAIALGLLSGEAFDQLVDPMRLAKGHQ